MIDTGTGPRRARVADVGWAAMAVICGIVLLGSIGRLAALLVHLEIERGVFRALGLVGWWWLSRGAWKRTVWGAPGPDDPSPPLPPELSVHRATSYIWLGVACTALLVTAVLVQIALARL